MSYIPFACEDIGIIHILFFKIYAFNRITQHQNSVKVKDD